MVGGGTLCRSQAVRFGSQSPIGSTTFAHSRPQCQCPCVGRDDANATAVPGTTPTRPAIPECPSNDTTICVGGGRRIIVVGCGGIGRSRLGQTGNEYVLDDRALSLCTSIVYTLSKTRQRRQGRDDTIHPPRDNSKRRKTTTTNHG